MALLFKDVHADAYVTDPAAVPMGSNVPRTLCLVFSGFSNTCTV